MSKTEQLPTERTLDDAIRNFLERHGPAYTGPTVPKYQLTPVVTDVGEAGDYTVIGSRQGIERALQRMYVPTYALVAA